MCHYSRPLNDTFVVGCCKDYDLCNRDLKPVLHVRNTTGKIPLNLVFFSLSFIAFGAFKKSKRKMVKVFHFILLFE